MLLMLRKARGNSFNIDDSFLFYDKECTSYTLQTKNFVQSNQINNVFPSFDSSNIRKRQMWPAAICLCHTHIFVTKFQLYHIDFKTSVG